MFKVGDEVWSDKFGVGIVEDFSLHLWYPVVVDFKEAQHYYTTEGGYWEGTASDADIVPYTGQDIKEPEVHLLDRGLFPNNPPNHSARVPVGSDITDYRFEHLSMQEVLTVSHSFNTEIPDHVRRHLLGDMNARLDELREAVEWFVEQLGGNVEWEEELEND